MEIQGSINQLLSIAAVAAKFDPAAEKRTKLREMEKSMEGLKTQLASARGMTEEETPAVAKERLRISEDMVKLSRERLNLDPTEENWAKHMRNVKLNEQEPGRQNIISPDEVAREEAAKALSTEQARLRAGNEVIRPSGLILTPPSMGTRRER